jgi:hypothetical protein
MSRRRLHTINTAGHTSEGDGDIPSAESLHDTTFRSGAATVAVVRLRADG